MMAGIPQNSVVAIAKSKSAVYDQVDFRSLLVENINHLAQVGINLPSSGTVFLKPNVVIGETAIASITTDPHFIFELIKLLRENGVREVFVGDSSASYIKSPESFKSAGLWDVIQKAGATFINIDDPRERTNISLPGSDIVASLSVPRKALEADYLINFGKLKTHRVGSFTCCVKNYVGFIDQKTRLENHQTRLPKLVAELHRAMPESICFGDGVIVGEGDGPDLSRPRFLGVLLTSNDPVALDVIGAQLLGIDRNDLVFPWIAHREGVGEIDTGKILLLGTRPEDVSIKIGKPNEVLYHRFPCNIVLGGLCEGCFAWFMGPALFWERDGVWEKIYANVGRPTMMLGFNAVDLNFEKHLQEGPYFVIGDCTPEKFRNDPRVIFIPGCCPGPEIPNVILKHCKIGS